ncbi:putative bifunctional diguanylate cyclase/phosphodiesterase [Edaphosphingomonas haloaromaticamans]|uniref:Cyclic di-GMP phosphodiesterase Gmr n=1 Tax=Edaphosphingomonas haloaromaticamans TaxID=653954 RepID=A0A1S1HER6_9SPHN|nr:EAL domain-containing protein [Sphingomonas haloaromaticamans]OHT20302.1 Cyclic di-GMP phosphodiesterase Gmr [Sphingomonas haloaromaticamans]
MESHHTQWERSLAWRIWRRNARKLTGLTSARRDMVTGGITVAAILLFAWTGGTMMGRFFGRLMGDVAVSDGDRLLTTAVILNIALLLFGWRRYRDLQHEVSERAVAEERAHSLAASDPLTGLLNRRSLGDGGAALLARAGRNRAMAVMMIDLDHFKTVNDLHGHGVGDKLLKACAAAIEGALPPGALVARLGGDEFACAVLTEAGSTAHIDAMADGIAARLSSPFDLDGARAHVTASIGIARSERECGEMEALMRRADIAMYAAKRGGRNRVAWFDTSMERELQLRNAIEAGLRDGIPKGEFVPYYEQQIDLSTGSIQGFEVLARWDHPVQGVIGPDIFIPIAEECGLIGDLSTAVMRQAFEEAKGWDPALTLSVNISPSQLKDPWLAQKIVKLLVETGFPASRLEIEITETSLFDNLGLAQSIIGSLKNQGIRLALDDFGTGYSSLAHLRALPFDRIKIDKSFVLSMTDNPESAAIVTAITRLGESLSLPITAEGIEDAGIIEQLKAIGCHKGQGWHYGKPMTVNQVRRLLAEHGMLLPGRGPAAGPGVADYEGPRIFG